MHRIIIICILRCDRRTGGHTDNLVPIYPHYVTRGVVIIITIIIIIIIIIIMNVFYSAIPRKNELNVLNVQQMSENGSRLPH